MADINIEKPSEEKLKQLGVSSWPIWEKEKSRFDWYYDTDETCYILEGRATVETKDGKRVNFGKGDLITFPKGLDCVWQIEEGIRKHYKL